MSKGIGIRWWTSPTCARILERLECRGIGMPEEIARDVHCFEKYAYTLLKLLEQHNRIAVAYWKHNARGLPTHIYRIGPGPGKPMPKQETPAQRCARRRAALIEQYGKDAANRILGNSRSTRGLRIHIDGQRITPGHAARKLSGSIT